ncbi:Odorant receptor 101 [Nylanderia fulva]|uniref:Odorant receptor n=1 Tax=Nylanderia fulva TaxID=613905 RepID=A0A6G1LQU7_9HYME|nr:odorant receptor 4-like [Nylanderia fulva]KAF3054614.1 Odorant receptor 101 [Nylanderia fulva]
MGSIVNPAVEFGLRAIGIWPGSPRAMLCRICWTVSLGLAQTFQFRYIIACIETNNFPDLVDSVSTTLPYSLLCLKLIILWLNQRLFNDILTSMLRDWRNCDSIALNMRIMMNKTNVSHRCSMLIIGIYAMAVVVYSSVIIELNNMDTNAETSEKELFLKMKFPFVHEFSPIYEIVMFVQFIQLLSNASVIGMLNALIMTLILHVSGQIDIVCRGLFELFSGKREYKSWKNATGAVIRKHQDLIAFSDNIEKLFSYIALLQFLTNTLVICCIAFAILTSIASDQGYALLLKSFFFYIAITLEAFIFCFAGEYLSNKSKLIANTAYEAFWYDAKPNESRVLLIIMLRSQKRLTLTIGKFNDLSLQVFGDTLKASASYVSVLLTMS